jgi:hypothetical protein
MGMGILGALAGAGQGMAAIGEHMQKQWDEKNLLAEKNRMDIEKEGRINQHQIDAEGRQQGYQVAQEGRAATAHAAQLQSDFDFKNNPANTAAESNAAISKQTALDAYNKSTLSDRINEAQKLSDIEKNKQIEVANKTYHPDPNKDIQRQVLQENLKQMQEAGKIPARVNAIIQGNQKRIEILGKDLTDLRRNGGSPLEIKDVNDEIDKFHNENSNLLKQTLDEKTLATLNLSSKPAVPPLGVYPSTPNQGAANNPPVAESVTKNKGSGIIPNANLIVSSGSMKKPAKNNDKSAEIQKAIDNINSNQSMSAEDKKAAIDYINKNN